MKEEMVYPRPQWIKKKDKDFRFHEHTIIMASPNRRREAEHLREWLRGEYGYLAQHLFDSFKDAHPHFPS